MDFNIKPVDTTTTNSIWCHINQKTKPIGALGKLESLAHKIALIQQKKQLSLNIPKILLLAGDHGLAEEAISPYPQAVTFEMVRNFTGQGAAINVFARQHAISLDIIDCGIKNPNGLDGVIPMRLGPGTKNSLREPAMSSEQIDQALHSGAQLVRDAFNQGCEIIGFGEMGIGNSSAAALITSSILDLPIERTVGRGTGCNNEQLAQKTSILKQVLARPGSLMTPLQAMREFGGFEMAVALGGMLQAASLGMIAMIDGFIMGSVALCAVKLYPQSQDYFIFCHKSASPGHQHILTAISADPLLDLGMRLGEGSGVAVAWPIIASAVRFYNEMSSFAEAEVSQAHE